MSSQSTETVVCIATSSEEDLVDGLFIGVKASFTLSGRSG